MFIFFLFYIESFFGSSVGAGNFLDVPGFGVQMTGEGLIGDLLVDVVRFDPVLRKIVIVD